MKYAWFTVGLPESTPQEAVTLLKTYGYHGIEWRAVTDIGDTLKPGFWSGNKTTLQESWTDAQFKEIFKITRDAGLEVPNLGSYARASEPDRVKRMMEVAVILGAPSLRVNVAWYDGKRDYNELFEEDIEAYGKIIEMSKIYKIKPLVEIHMGTIVASASAALRYVSIFDPEEIGVIHDAGNMVYEGFENYKAGLEMLGPYLAHVHIKNSMPVSEPAEGSLPVKWKVMAAPLRKGMVDFKALFTALKSMGYNGWMSVEDFSTEASQIEKVKDNLDFLKSIESSV